MTVRLKSHERNAQKHSKEELLGQLFKFTDSGELKQSLSLLSEKELAKILDSDKFGEGRDVYLAVLMQIREKTTSENFLELLDFIKSNPKADEYLDAILINASNPYPLLGKEALELAKWLGPDHAPALYSALSKCGFMLSNEGIPKAARAMGREAAAAYFSTFSSPEDYRALANSEVLALAPFIKRMGPEFAKAYFAMLTRTASNALFDPTEKPFLGFLESMGPKAACKYLERLDKETVSLLVNDDIFKTAEFAKWMGAEAAGEYYGAFARLFGDKKGQDLLGRMTIVKTLTADEFLEFASAMGPAAAGYLKVLNFENLEVMTGKKVFGAAESIKKFDSDAAYAWFSALATTRAASALSDPTVFEAAWFANSTDLKVALAFFDAIGMSHAPDLLASMKVLKLARVIGFEAAEAWFAAIQSRKDAEYYTRGPMLGFIQSLHSAGLLGQSSGFNRLFGTRAFRELAEGRLAISDELVLAVKDNLVNLSDIYSGANFDMPSIRGRVRASSYIPSVVQAATSRGRAPGYSGSQYLSAVLGLSQTYPAYPFYSKVMEWLDENKPELHARILSLSESLRKLAEENAGERDQAVAGCQLSLPGNLNRIAARRVLEEPKDREVRDILESGLTSSFRAASWYAAPFNRFEQIHSEILKHPPDASVIEAHIREMERVLGQQQGLRFDAPPLHGGARGEEPPPWDIRSYKTAKNVFQKVELRSKRVVMPLMESDKAEITGYVKEGGETKAVGFVGARQTLYVNSNNYSIADPRRAVSITFHSFSTEPSEMKRGNAGIAVEAELQKGNRRIFSGFLDERQVRRLAEMLRKKTLASLLVSGEFEEFLKS